MHLEAGDPLFDLYSPDLQLAIEELIASRRARTAGQAGDTGAALYDAAAQKLELLGLERPQIEALAKLDRAPESVTFASPITGHVTEKPIVEGAAVKSGDRVLRIVDHSALWLDARVFEQDLPSVRVGDRATATIADGVGTRADGEIIFLHPHVDMATRTALARLVIQNPSLTLRPGMYATVRVESQVTERTVLAPREAVIDTGESQLVFVVPPGAAGTFEPRQVRMGLPAEDGLVQIVHGLSPGEQVVTSGQFLLDSESRLREAIQKFLSEKTHATSGSRSPDTAPPAPHSASPRDTDAAVAAYLALAGQLGAPQHADTPVDAAPLAQAARSVQKARPGTPLEQPAADLAAAAESMRGRPLDDQRELFKEVSRKVIALAEAAPPGSRLAPTLYVMHCPMADADWLQRDDSVANPYYATDMKRCGSVQRTIPPRGSAAP